MMFDRVVRLYRVVRNRVTLSRLASFLSRRPHNVINKLDELNHTCLYIFYAPMLNYITVKFGITRLRDSQNTLLNWVTVASTLHVLKWLHRVSPITAEDLTENNYGVLQSTVIHKKDDMLDWYASLYPAVVRLAVPLLQLTKSRMQYVRPLLTEV